MTPGIDALFRLGMAFFFLLFLVYMWRGDTHSDKEFYRSVALAVVILLYIMGLWVMFEF